MARYRQIYTPMASGVCSKPDSFEYDNDDSPDDDESALLRIYLNPKRFIEFADKKSRQQSQHHAQLDNSVARQMNRNRLSHTEQLQYFQEKDDRYNHQQRKKKTYRNI